MQKEDLQDALATAKKDIESLKGQAERHRTHVIEACYLSLSLSIYIYISIY